MVNMFANAINEERLNQLTLSELRMINKMFSNDNRKKGTLYDCHAVDEMLDIYAQHDGECIHVHEGGCGCGDYILYGYGLKTTIITEVYLNEWSSAHKIRSYNKTPKKYEKIIEMYENGAEFPIGY